MRAIHTSDIALFHPSTWAAWLPEDVFEKIPSNVEVAIGTYQTITHISLENEYQTTSTVSYIIFDRDDKVYFGDFQILSEEEIQVEDNAKDIVFSTLRKAIEDSDDTPPSAA